MMTHVKRAYMPSLYGQLHYRIVSPPRPVNTVPLLCLHQTPSSSKDWLPVMPALGQHRVIIAVDTPGYGMSDAPPNPASIEDLAQVMAQFMADLARDGIVDNVMHDIMGFHTGSVIATQMARAFPKSVRRLVLFGLAAFADEKRSRFLQALPDMFPKPDHSLRHVEKLWQFIETFFDSRITAQARHQHLAECLRAGDHIPWGYVSVFQYDFRAALSAITQSTLVINPQDDLWDATKSASQLLQNGRRWDLPGVSHGVLEIEHDKIVAEIEVFLDESV